MATITPGYDFGVNEIPTRDKFLAQAQGMSVGDISSDILDANFLTLLIGDTSGASGGLLTDQGQLWISPDGSVWGRTGRGDVQVHRAEGGWETNRINFVGDNHGEGAGWTMDDVATNVSLSGDPDALRYDTGAGIDLFITAETTHSGPMRLTGRGVCRYVLESGKAVSESSFRKHSNQFRIHGPPVNAFWDNQDFFTSDQQRFVGPALGLPGVPEATKVSQAGGPFSVEGSVWGYYHGVRMFGSGGTV
jgi:hypothetical protein